MKTVFQQEIFCLRLILLNIIEIEKNSEINFCLELLKTRNGNLIQKV